MPDTPPSQRLEDLLKLPRSETKAGLVEAVLVQVLTTDEKIQRIDMIDLMAEEAPRAVGPSKPRGSLIRGTSAPVAVRSVEEDGPPVVQVSAADREAALVWQARRGLRASVRTGFWIGYLATEYHALLRFGIETGTLGHKWLPFSLKFTPELKVFLSKSLPDLVLPVLGQALPQVLARAWAVLPRSEYNLLAALAVLTRHLSIVRPPLKGRKSSAWFGLLDPAIPSLVLFRTAPGLVSRTLQAWSSACLKLDLPDAQRTAGTESIRTLLDSRSDQISLPDALKALVSLPARRVVELAEFVPKAPADYFCRDGFDAAPEVLAEIEKAVLQFEGQLESLEKESQDLLRVAYFVPPEDLLGSFYLAGGRDGAQDPETDRFEPPRWTIRFLDLVAATFGPLLAGSVKLESGQAVMLLGNAALSSSLERLEGLKQQLLDPVQGRNPALGHDVARVLMSLGKTLVVLIRNRSRLADPLVRAADPEALTDPLPFEGDKIDQPAEWAGETVIEALVRAARLCFQASRRLGDTSLDATLSKREGLSQRAHEILVRAATLAGTERLDAIKERWGPLLAPPQEPK